MAGFPLINLPGYQAQNALNFSPLSNAIQSNQDNALAQRQMAMQEQRNALLVGQDKRAAETHGFDMAARKRQQDVEEARQAAGRIQYIQGLPADQQPGAWQQTLQLPGFRDLPPDLRDFNRAAPVIMGKAAEYIGPQERAQLGLVGAQTRKADAEAQKAAREASDVGGQGKAGTIVQGPDGRYYATQFAASGPPRVYPLQLGGSANGAPTPLTPSKGVMQIGDELVEKGTGRTVRSAAEALQGGEIAKGRGDALVKLETSLPKSRATLEAANAKVALVLNKVDQAIPLVSNWSVGPGSYLSNLPATQARDLREIANTIVANLGFDELQEMRSNSPTGGALGAIAVQELEMLQKTKTSLDQAQTVGQYMQALKELKSFYSGAVSRRQRAFDETYAPLAQRRTGNGPVEGPREPRQFTGRLPPAGGPAPGVQGMIPPHHVQYLRGNPDPDIIRQFEEKYGPGSARQFLGGQ